MQASDDYYCYGCTLPPPTSPTCSTCGGGKDGGDGGGQQQDITITDFADNFVGGWFPTNQLLDPWEGEGEIDPAESDQMLLNIRSDVRQAQPARLMISSFLYDTPFYNNYGQLSGRGCIYGECYDRSVLNYVAQGELWAAVGATRTETYGIAYAWKYTINGCVVADIFSDWACSAHVVWSFEEIKTMIDIGYDDYYQDPRPLAPWPEPVWP